MLMNSDDVKRDEVEMLVKELLEGQKGKQLKTRAIEWKNLSQQAANTDGSSFSQFGENGLCLHMQHEGKPRVVKVP
ncbi:hypothetical protein Ahy_A10g050770 isoform G [Arachis hypogaea]|uniref:Uncharacterized protein n=1 Tax=Arachis hypogaea TaxID=3818 RepID=A0A445BAB9_ARAHY|nr:hypothetical protein Ahy_A10g050770 isoform G [Arachis hypogaea]